MHKLHKKIKKNRPIIRFIFFIKKIDFLFEKHI